MKSRCFKTAGKEELMKLKCCKFDEFTQDIRTHNTKIVMFGAGVIGRIVVPEILDDLGLLNMVDCYVDNSTLLWGEKISVYGKLLDIRSPEYLCSCARNTVILLNVSRFSDVLKQLENMANANEMKCYITPMMLIHNFCLSPSSGSVKRTEEAVIPKKLHYMWLGGNPIPDNLKRCIDTWYKYCSEYEIIEWNENNYDLEKNKYMKQAYETKAYGFVPDYARLDILYNQGGLYLDTDVELRRNVDDLLYQEAFCGVEKWQTINFGGLSGSIKGHPMVKRFLDARESIEFIDEKGNQNRNTCGFYDTNVAIKSGYRLNGKNQNINGMNIYAYDYFQPYDYMSGTINETENTHSVHWFNGGWLDEVSRKANDESRSKYMILYKQALED